MNEVLEGGTGGSPVSQWKWVVACAVILVGGLAVILSGRGPDHAAGLTASTATPKPWSDSTPSWPTVQGACNSLVYLPQRSAYLRSTGLNGKLLVGGSRLHELAPGAVDRVTVAAVPEPAGRLVTDLVSGPDSDYVRTTSCSGSQSRVYRVVGNRARLLPGPTDGSLFGGAHHAWRVTHPRSGPVLTPLDHGHRIQLPSGAELFADTEAGLVVTSVSSHPKAQPEVGLIDAVTGHRLRDLGSDQPMAAAGHTLILESTGCEDVLSPECVLTRVDLNTGRSTDTYPLATRQLPAGVGAVLSRDQNVLAFQLGRDAPDLRFAQSSLLAPSDIAMMNLHTGRLAIVPDFAIAPENSVGLALDSTGKTVVFSGSFGDRVEVFMWKAGMRATGLIATLPGSYDSSGPPILLTRRSST